MTIAIIEHEIYLAQSIASKLQSLGYNTELFSSVKDASGFECDIFLLSTSIPGQSVLPLIGKNKEKIIILMVNHINNDSVSRPLKEGADDYIVKPFMIEELVRKITHHLEHQKLKEEATLYRSYIDNLHDQIKLEMPALTTPCVLEVAHQQIGDKVAFEYARANNRKLCIVSLKKSDYLETILNSSKEQLLLVCHFDELKKGQKRELLGILASYDFILCSNEPIEGEIPHYKPSSSSHIFSHNEIISINDYVKQVITSFQYKYPDTEISKRLGISRKSLWEKRKKYNLLKKR